MSAASFRERFARRLEASAAEITDAWLGRLPADPRHEDDELREHVAELLAELPAAVREPAPPGASLPSDRRGRLLELVGLCRTRGCSLPRVLEGLHLLQAELDEEMHDTITAAGGPSAQDVHDVQRSLHRELGRIERTAVSIYMDAESRRRSEAAERFSSFSRALEHEMRDPLQIALGTVDHMERAGDEDIPERRDEQLRILEDQLERMTELLTEARTLSVMEQLPEEDSWMPGERMVAEIFDEVAPRAAAKGVDLRAADPPDDLEVSVPQVRLAVRNLVANAIKYSDPDEPDPYVEVSFRDRPGGGCRLVVEDNGLGVPDGVEDRIFEPGVRAHPDVGSGAGIGLALVRELMDEAGGSVSVESVEGRGSRFVLELPASLVALSA